MKVDGAFKVVGAQGPLAYFGALTPEQLSHGYLFTGIPGVGKKTFARRLAQSLLCERPKTTLLGYDNTCTSCLLMRANTHPDYVESSGEMRIGKSDDRGEDLSARELVRLLSLHAYRSARRFVVLGDVSFATHEAANALLKFFEEPPGGVHVILTTDRPGRLLATIRSRLCEVAFAPLRSDEVQRVLEHEGVATADAQRAALVALGSITRARAVLEGQDVSARAAAMAWFAASLAGEPFDLRLDERGERAADRREFLASVLEEVRIIARDWAALSIAGAEAPLLAGDLRAQIERMPARTPAQSAVVLQAVADVQRLAYTNVSPGLVADYLRVALAAQPH